MQSVLHMKLLPFQIFTVMEILVKIFEELQVIEFADGEIEVEILSSIRGKDVFLIASAGRNTNPYIVQRIKWSFIMLLIALRRAQAARITLFEPYCTCSRSDRTTRRNSVGFWIHYKTLAALGVDHIITYQLHSEKSRTVVDPSHCAIDDIPADSLPYGIYDGILLFVI